jgi:hypothetical protein
MSLHDNQRIILPNFIVLTSKRGNPIAVNVHAIDVVCESTSGGSNIFTRCCSQADYPFSVADSFEDVMLAITGDLV